MFFFKIYQKKQWRANEALEWKAISSNQYVILETHKGALQFEKKRDAPRVHFTNGRIRTPNPQNTNESKHFFALVT